MCGLLGVDPQLLRKGLTARRALLLDVSPENGQVIRLRHSLSGWVVAHAHLCQPVIPAQAVEVLPSGAGGDVKQSGRRVPH